MNRRWKDLAVICVRVALALACGVAVGVLLNLAIFVGPSLLHPTPKPSGPPYFLSTSFFVNVTATASLEFGAGIALLSVPMWLWLGKLGRQTPVFAAGLGFLMTYVVYAVVDSWPTLPTWGIVQDGAIFACVGAVCGLVVWAADRGLQRVGRPS